MPTNRSPRARGTRRHQINEAAIAAWRAADYIGLHRALNLHPGHPSPLPSTITPLGVDPDAPPDEGDGRAWARGWSDAVALQRQLMATAGPPDSRAAYGQNLKEAEEMAAYYRSLLAEGKNVAEELEDALLEVEWRKELLTDLK
jgi:hypothetical protein